MGCKIFLAGATGAVGKRLLPLLLAAGHKVVGTTRSTDKVRALEAAGAEAVVVDVFDAPGLTRAVRASSPQVIVHQLTDLPFGLDPARMVNALVPNARIRSEGTRNLVAAALAASAHRLVSQSIAWAYALRPEPYTEDCPLDLQAEGSRAITVHGIEILERLTLQSPPLDGIVLRYGQLYGPGTGRDEPSGSVPLHVDAAAWAAALAVERGTAGAFNLADNGRFVAIDKAQRELSWDPAFRLPPVRKR